MRPRRPARMRPPSGWWRRPGTTRLRARRRRLGPTRLRARRQRRLGPTWRLAPPPRLARRTWLRLARPTSPRLARRTWHRRARPTWLRRGRPTWLREPMRRLGPPPRRRLGLRLGLRRPSRFRHPADLRLPHGDPPEVGRVPVVTLA